MDQLLGPGGEHEFLTRATAPHWKKWGITANELRTKYSIPISDLNEGIAKGWKHSTGKAGSLAPGSTKVHNQLKKIILKSKSLDEFRNNIVPWAEKWLRDGVKSLPPALQ